MNRELNVTNLEQRNQTAASERAQDHVQHDRLQSVIAELATFGGRTDGGVSRETLTDYDLQARRYLIDLARSRGCSVMIDDAPICFSVVRGHPICRLCSLDVTPIPSR